MRVKWIPKETEKLLSSPYSMWENLGRHFSKKKVQRKKFNKKRLNSSEHHPLELFRNHGEKDTYNRKREEKYSQLVTTTCKKFETKERKKDDFEFRHHISISVKTCFCKVQLFLVSVQRWVSPFNFPILSFYFLKFFVLNQMIFLNSTMHSEICAIPVEMYVRFISFEINSLVNR